MQMTNFYLNSKMQCSFLFFFLFLHYAHSLPAQCDYLKVNMDDGTVVHYDQKKTGLIGVCREGFIYANVSGLRFNDNLPCLLITLMPGVLESYTDMDFKPYAIIEWDLDKAILVQTLAVDLVDNNGQVRDNGQFRIVLILNDENLVKLLGSEDIKIMLLTEEDRFTLLADELKNSVIPCLYSFNPNIHRY